MKGTIMTYKKNLQLNLKISAMLGIIIFTIIFLYVVLYTRRYQVYEDKVIGQENLNTLHSINSSLSTMIEGADDYSKMILADSVVQQLMGTGNILTDFSRQQTLMKRIYSVMQFSANIDMIWLTDQQGQRLTIGDNASIFTEHNQMSQDHFEQLRKPYGTPELIVEKGETHNSLMLIRSFTSLEQFTSLGLIGVQISYEKLDALISKSIDFSSEQIAILNFENETIYSGGISEFSENTMTAAAINLSETGITRKKHPDGKDYYLSGIVNPKNGWKIIRCTPVVRNTDADIIVKYNMLLITITGLLIFCGAAAISNLLAYPIQQLLNHMKHFENGQLEKISEQTLFREFKALFHGYNVLVDEIHSLIRETVERQKRIRIVEMNEIQEQMKPHFLYNALDCVEALAMLGDTDRVCKLIESLGGFYKKCVSGGREYLSIGDEIHMVRDYMEILKIRFEDRFCYDIELDESCKDYKIPKLTIQPLVENSFQHGIRPKRGPGSILVRIRQEQHLVHILVQDNGKGIPDEMIRELLDAAPDTESKSLGLRGTIQRLKLIYDTAFTYEIKNQKLSEIHFYLDSSALGDTLWKN